MHETISTLYPPGNGASKEEYIVTSHKEDGKHAPGAISYVIGSNEITIRSTNRGYGAIPIEGIENLKLLRDALIKICNIEEFNTLFEELTGIKPENAKKGEDGFLFVPPEVNLGEKDPQKRGRLAELNGDNWRNHLVNDEYAGWWIGTPLHGIKK